MLQTCLTWFPVPLHCLDRRAKPCRGRRNSPSCFQCQCMRPDRDDDADHGPGSVLPVGGEVAVVPAALVEHLHRAWLVPHRGDAVRRPRRDRVSLDPYRTGQAALDGWVTTAGCTGGSSHARPASPRTRSLVQPTCPTAKGEDHQPGRKRSRGCQCAGEDYYQPAGSAVEVRGAPFGPSGPQFVLKFLDSGAQLVHAVGTTDCVHLGAAASHHRQDSRPVRCPLPHPQRATWGAG